MHTATYIKAPIVNIWARSLSRDMHGITGGRFWQDIKQNKDMKVLTRKETKRIGFFFLLLRGKKFEFMFAMVFVVWQRL